MAVKVWSTPSTVDTHEILYRCVTGTAWHEMFCYSAGVKNFRVDRWAFMSVSAIVSVFTTRHQNNDCYLHRLTSNHLISYVFTASTSRILRLYWKSCGLLIISSNNKSDITKGFIQFCDREFENVVEFWIIVTAEWNNTINYCNVI